MKNRKKRILIIDDEDPMRLILKEIFLSMEDRCEVVGEGANGREALEKYQKLKPDLVTMDFKMPEVDGLQGLKRILAYDPKANVVMVTSILERELMSEALKIGAKEFIAKPFEGERIIFTVNNLLFGKKNK